MWLLIAVEVDLMGLGDDSIDFRGRLRITVLPSSLFLSGPLEGGFWLPWLRGVCCVLAVAADADFRVDGGDWGFDTCACYIDYYFQVAC